MDSVKNKYEITFVITVEDSSIVKKLLEKNGLSITEEKTIKKVKLSYPIKKQVYAFAGIFEFTAKDKNALSGLDNDLRLCPEVIRSMVSKAKLKEKEEPRSSEDKSKPAKFVKKQSETSDVLTNEALEKKIAEMI